MKSRFVVATVVAVALACLAEPILAQAPGGQGGQPGQRGQRGAGGFGGGGFGGGGFGNFGGGGFGGRTSRLSLLNIAEVQKELELVDEQLTAIQKVRDELQPMRGRGGPGGQPGQPGGQPGQRGRRGGNNGGANPPANPNGASLATPDRFYVQQEAQPPQAGQRGQRGQGGQGGQGGFGGFQITEEQRAEFEKQRIERLKAEKEKLGEILLPHQVKRLNEIFFQQLGINVVDDPDVVAELKITDEQKKKFAEVRTANQESLRAVYQEFAPARGAGGEGAGGAGGRGAGGRGGFGLQLTEEQQKKVDDARKANDEKILAVLTDGQRKQLDEMKGMAFAMPENTGRGRGGPGGAPGAGGAPGRARGGNNN